MEQIVAEKKEGEDAACIHDETSNVLLVGRAVKQVHRGTWGCWHECRVIGRQTAGWPRDREILGPGEREMAGHGIGENGKKN